MRFKRNTVAIFAALVTLSASVVATWTGASGAFDQDATSTDAGTGAGETLLLVVADVVDTPNAISSLGTLNERFGDLQGFYVDATDAYELMGVLLQTSPDLAIEPCPDVLDEIGSIVAFVPSDDDCPVGDVATILQPITMTLVGLDGITRLDPAVFCARSGDACGLERVQELLGEDQQLPPSASILATGFRTKRGAQEFLELARSAGVTDLVTLQVKKLGGADIGLGQEPAPDGSGPLNGPLADQEAYQR
jgi:hypothetical protein